MTAGGGRVWVTLRTEPAQLVEIDPSSNEVVDSFEVPSQPRGRPLRARRRLGHERQHQQHHEDAPDGNPPTQIPIGARSDDMAVGGRVDLGHESRDDAITRIDIQQPSKHQRLRVGRRPEGVAADDRNVWVVNQDDNSVTRLDAHSPFKKLDEYPVGETPSDVVVDEAGVAWVVNTGDNTVSRIEP